MLTLERLQLEHDGFRLSADLTIEAGILAAVIGPSGGGKSTLLNTIAGFVTPDTGAVKWDGETLNNLLPGDRPISIAFQDNNLFPHLTIFQNVAVGLNPSMRLSDPDSARINDALARVGLAGLAERKPATLSGGQQSRVTLARMLVRDRPLLLLDEPFAALGPAMRNEMLDLVAELVRLIGATVLMVTHDPEDARRIADQTVYVENGLAHRPMATDLLLDDPPDALRAYLGR